MATRIRILPETLINQIAAGEVVEGPASVVKELVENALDAGATQITVELSGGGRALLRITDNGCGMSRDDALLALERHATSKIASSEDLFDIRTMGFRGEALAAISSVSKLELVTRMGDTPQGCRVFAHGGVVRQVEGVEAPPGTTLTVRDLFFNTPARQKFLKSPQVETAAVIDVLSRLALAHEHVGFTLLRGPETLLQAQAGVAGAPRVAALLGAELADHLHPFRAERAGIQVWGFLSDPEVSRAGWSSLYAFVNARSLKDRLLSKAVGEAYKGSIPKGRYPAVVLFLRVDPAEVDVNVHPGKLEVRFARPKSVSELVQNALLATLNRAPWKRAAAGLGVPFTRQDFEEPTIRGVPLAPQAQLELDAHHISAAEFLPEPLESPFGVKQADPEPPVELSSPHPTDSPPFSEEEERARIESLSLIEPPTWVRPQARGPQSTTPTPVRGDAPQPPAPRPPLSPQRSEARADQPLQAPPPSAPEPDPGERGALLEPPPVQEPAPALASAALVSAPGPAVAPPSSTRPALERPGILPGFEARNFSRMRIIGQYANCFILCQDGDELVILDQHAAHERVTFEQLRAAYEGMQGRSQLLLTPRIVDLPRRESELLVEYQDAFSRLGLEIEPFGGPTWAVKALPLALVDEDPASLLSHIASDLSGDTLRAPLKDRIYLMLATMACHGSIRANRPMKVPEMEALLKLLDGTPFAYACPHGRPLVARSTRREVERLFKRT